MSAVLFGLAVLELNLMIQPCPFQMLILRGDMRLDFNVGLRNLALQLDFSRCLFSRELNIRSVLLALHLQVGLLPLRLQRRIGLLLLRLDLRVLLGGLLLHLPSICAF
jgi:hypothetical protein